MAPRAMWKGQLRLSLVTFGVRLYAATESSNRVSMNQLHKGCHQRIKNQTVCPIHGPVSRDEIVKGYEYEKDTYVIIDEEDLAALKLESNKVIDLVQFVDEGEIDPMYVDSPYFLGPDGPVAEEAFGVIREAMRKTKKVGIGTLVMSGRERIVSIHPEGKGFILTTLRYADEVRDSKTYFEDIHETKGDKELVDLAESIIKSKSKRFDPEAFTDHYRDAFFEMVKQKVRGEKPIVVEEEDVPASYNFMDALKRSVEQVEAGEVGGAATKAKSGSKKAPAKKKAAASKKPAKKPAAKSVSGSSSKKKSKRA